MCDSVYLEVIKPVNRCNIVGIEKIIKSEIVGKDRVIVTEDNFKQYRVILQNRESKLVKSGIVFDKFRTVRFKYTLPEYRGYNFTKQLFAYIQIATGKRFYHSDNLTEAGKAAI